MIGYKYRKSLLYYSDKEEYVKVMGKKTMLQSLENSLSLEDLLFPPTSKLTEDRIERLYDVFIKDLISTTYLFNKRIGEVRTSFKTITKHNSNGEEVKTVEAKEIKEEKDIIVESNEEPKKKWITQALELNDPTKITKNIMDTTQTISETTLKLWKEYIDSVLLVPRQLANMLLENYNKTQLHIFKQFIKSTQTKIMTFPFLVSHNAAIEHQNSIKTIRNDIFTKFSHTYPIKELSTFGKLDEVPILFEEIYSRSELPLAKPIIDNHKGNLFIFVHGFQATSSNMKTMKNVIQLRFPDIQTLCPVSNDKSTEGDIQVMGDKLANEINTHIKKWFTNITLNKIFFFGHSLGGILIRAALPKLVEYKDKMQSLITFSTPHLGCLYKTSKLVGAGMWLLKKWNTSKSLEQLEMSDSKTLSNTFMYKLSLMEGLEWFKNILLLSSYLDQYSPYESSRMEVGKKQESNPEYIKMANNILSRIKAESLYRIDVAFNIKKTSINSFIGREAHLQFLENETLLKLIAYSYADN